MLKLEILKLSEITVKKACRAYLQSLLIYLFKHYGRISYLNTRFLSFYYYYVYFNYYYETRIFSNVDFKNLNKYYLLMN